ncbi:Protein of unknown function [Cotesia congregata]|uniref:Uncharacterized protein n=1 Tax=Cotesia congregata TaxID=51543 RepID=A0A8J2MJR8_COTCN|nr:Protein of unknown function [Cotesia congregata]
MHSNDIDMKDNGEMGGAHRSNCNHREENRFRFPYIKGLSDSITRSNHTAANIETKLVPSY